MPSKIAKFAILIVTLGLLGATHFILVDTKSLAGDENKIDKIPLSTKTFLKGDYQKNFESLFLRQLGSRPFLVRTENDINYKFFGDASKNLGTIIMPGSDNFLIEQAYVHSYNRSNPNPPEIIVQLTERLERLQSLLADKEISFNLLITPSKAEVYPEKIPSNFRHPERASRQSDYLTFLQFAKDKKINLIDASKLTKKLKKTSEFPVFAPGGIHWSYLTACKISQVLVDEMAGQLSKDLQRPVCEPVDLKTEPFGTETDMLRLLNLWDETAWKAPFPYPPMKESFYNAEKYHPTVLIVGDSFSLTPLHFFDKDGTFRKRRLMYYFSTEYNFWTTPKETGFKKNSNVREYRGKINADWDKVLEDRDAVVIFVNERDIVSAGHGFIEHILNYLQQDSLQK